MSLDFAIKDIIRKKDQSFPYIFTIASIIALTVFFVYFTSALGLSPVFPEEDDYFLSGGINIVFSQFNFLIVILVIVLAFTIVMIVVTTLFINKKRDIAIMKALGTLPRKLYSFYLLESYVIFIVGFLLGLLIGLIAFGIISLVIILLGFAIYFRLDLLFTPSLFFSCLIGIFILPGYVLRKIGSAPLTQMFSKDIPYDYDSSKGFTFIPKWLSSLGFNLKISLINTIRRKGEFKRYIIIVTIISLIIFTLGLGAIVLRSSSREWINKSQGENIIVIGHSQVLYRYSSMYRMFSDPTISINESNFQFSDSSYLFNLTAVEELRALEEVEKLDARLIRFCEVKELKGILISGTNYIEVGQGRIATIPIIGVNPSTMIQNFEVEGRFFTSEDSFENMTIGDGLAYNFFDYALNQGISLENLHKNFHISGVIIDSFFSGYAGYVGLDVFQETLNLNPQEINILLLKVKSGTYAAVKNRIEAIIQDNLGENFTLFNLDSIFQDNLNYLDTLTSYPVFLIILVSAIAVISLYNYLKGGLMEKAKDFSIMKAIGAKKKSLKKILFLESFFVLIPSIMLCLAGGMIINSVILFDRASLPPVSIPIVLITVIFVVFTLFIYLTVYLIMKKIERFNLSDFFIY